MDFFGAKDDGAFGVNWSYKMSNHIQISQQSNRHHNKRTRNFTGQMPVLSSNQRALKGKKEKQSFEQ